jgi:hypothetical protein
MKFVKFNYINKTNLTEIPVVIHIDRIAYIEPHNEAYLVHTTEGRLFSISEKTFKDLEYKLLMR